ncbi:MAG: endonuclease III, partial [Candidatus Eisenbacteria bacterium]
MRRKDPRTEGPAPERVCAILAILKRLYPRPRTALHFADPYQLLVATVLSAQCTDERVNQATPRFFERFPDAAALAAGKPAEIETLIYTTGFFRNKAKNLKAAAHDLVDQHGGHVPGNLPALVALPGIGRKTANVILGNAFGIPGITVDTHVRRVATRLAFTQATDPEKIELDLMEIWPRKEWSRISLRLIAHGRAICAARKPRCGECPLEPHCPAG